MPVTVVVDTTTTYGDVTLSRPRWIQLLSLAAREKITLIVPEIVVQETRRHRDEEARDALEALDRSREKFTRTLRHLRYLGIDLEVSVPELPSLDLAGDDAEHELRDRLDQVGAVIAPIPRTAHEDLVMRDLARRKPFSSTGRGYRDALIWESFKDAVKNTADVVIFATSNIDDFCDDVPRSLHADLLEELGEDAARVRWVRDVDELLQRPEVAVHVAELAKTKDELAQYLQGHGVDDAELYDQPSVARLIESALSGAIDGLDGEPVASRGKRGGLDFTALDIPTEIDDLVIEYVDPWDEPADWQTYETYEGETLLVTATARCDVRLAGRVQRSGFRLLEREDIEIDAFGGDSAEVRFTVEAKLQFQLRVEAGAGLVEDVAFESAEPV